MGKLRHTNGYYEGCYEDLDSKEWSVGATMTLKEALDLWWNSVRVKTAGGIMCCYKEAYTKYGTYELDELPKSALKRKVKLADQWDEDGDGYAIINAEFVD